MPKKAKSPIPIEQIDEMIHTIRGVRIMLDRDLAKIYGGQRASFNAANVPNKAFLNSSLCLLTFPIVPKTKKPPRHSCARRLLVDSFNLRESEGIERRLVDCRCHRKPVVRLISGERFPSQRPEQPIHLTCVIAHLL